MSAASVTLPRRLVAEVVGTALLLATVVGSGIMAESLADGNTAIALLANAVATGGVLVALIATFGAVSGAHFNPLVSGVCVLAREMSLRELALYTGAQLAGAFGGVGLAHLMFAKPLFTASQHVRATHSEIFSETIATFGLIVVILGTARRKPEAVPFAVGGYITAAYWFTQSTSFANPAVTLARAMTDTFAGIRPADAPAFMAAQVVGAAAGYALMRWLVPGRQT